METFIQKLLRYVRIWLIMAGAVVVGSVVAYWGPISSSFTSSIEGALSGLITIVFMILIIIYMIRGRL